MYCSSQETLYKGEYTPKNRGSNSTKAQQSSKSSQSSQSNYNLTDYSESKIQKVESQCFELKRQLTQLNTKKPSAKTNRSAVSWIQTHCWAKGFSFEVMMLSIVLYYFYCSKRSLQKSKVELILTTCIFLAKKYKDRSGMTIQSALDMLSESASPSEIYAMEAEILTIISFDMHFPLTIDLLSDYGLNNEEKFQMRFLIELCVLEDSRILYDKNLLEAVIALIRNKPLDFDGSLNFLGEVLLLKQAEIPLNKYKSHFQVRQFVNQVKVKLSQIKEIKNESIK